MDLDEIEDFEEEITDDLDDDAPEEVEDVSVLPPIKREDKIFNNRYNSGEGLVEGEEYIYSSRISVASDYADSYLKDLYDYEENLESRAILENIFNFIKSDRIITELLEKATLPHDFIPKTTKVKFSKDEINFIFNRIHDALDIKSNTLVFYSPIYILEVLSSLSSIEYKKLFDMMNTDVQEILLVELNKKYSFLDGKLNKKRIH